MTQIEKLTEKFLKTPEALKYPQIERILLHHNCILITAKGSHKKIKHPHAEKDLTIPVHNNECKNFYKKAAADFIRNNNII